MWTHRFMLLLAALALLDVACWTPPSALVKMGPDVAGVRIDGLSSCTEDVGDALVLDPSKPTIILVHGCNFSLAGFRTLARVFEAHGQQTVCFNYNDRDRLEESSAQLIVALEQLEQQFSPQEVTILGHSQGGLVARRALIVEREHSLRPNVGFRYRLVTVSSPFAGIESSRHCGITWLHALSLGATVGICQAITGSKWTEIPPGSSFMTEPGTLATTTESFIKIVTDESGSCRRVSDDGGCLEQDDIFSVAEQYNTAIDEDPRVAGFEVRAGHTEIVGEQGTAPMKLIQILQEAQVLTRAPKERRQEIAALIRRLYGVYTP